MVRIAGGIGTSHAPETGNAEFDAMRVGVTVCRIGRRFGPRSDRVSSFAFDRRSAAVRGIGDAFAAAVAGGY